MEETPGWNTLGTVDRYCVRINLPTKGAGAAQNSMPADSPFGIRFNVSPSHLVLQFLSITKSCLTLCESMDCDPPGSSVHGISQARILEWAAISLSRGSSWPRDRPRDPALQADCLLSELPGKSNFTGLETEHRWILVCAWLTSS